MKNLSDGWRAWTALELERFQKNEQGVALTAFMLALYTGQRKGDLLKMQWQEIKDGGIHVS